MYHCCQEGRRKKEALTSSSAHREVREEKKSKSSPCSRITHETAPSYDVHSLCWFITNSKKRVRHHPIPLCLQAHPKPLANVRVFLFFLSHDHYHNNVRIEQEKIDLILDKIQNIELTVDWNYKWLHSLRQKKAKLKT